MSAQPPKLHVTMDTIKRVIGEIGPATAREIEQHPDVVQACRSGKAKARRLIERLHRLGAVRSDGARQMPRFRVESDERSVS